MNRERCLFCDELGWWDQYAVLETAHHRRAFNGILSRKVCPPCAADHPTVLLLDVIEIREVKRGPEVQAYVEARRRGENPRPPWASLDDEVDW